MTPDAAFLQAIVEQPNDDTPRLIYADWLDEHGDASRADFIRVQVERARCPPGDPRHGVLQQRDFELRSQNEERWRHQLPTLRGIAWQRFWRGFVSGADVHSWKYYRRHADALFAATPIQFLRLHNLSGAYCRELVTSPYLSRLLGLDLSVSRVGDEGLIALANCPLFQGLRVLDLHARPPASFHTRSLTAYTASAGRALAFSPYLSGLERLDLRWADTALSEEVVRLLRERFGDRVIV